MARHAPSAAACWRLRAIFAGRLPYFRRPGPRLNLPSARERDKADAAITGLRRHRAQEAGRLLYHESLSPFNICTAVPAGAAPDFGTFSPYGRHHSPFFPPASRA